jgi:hypothetical protein
MKEQWHFIDYHSHDVLSIGGWTEAICECGWQSGPVYNSNDMKWAELKLRAKNHLNGTNKKFIDIEEARD